MENMVIDDRLLFFGGLFISLSATQFLLLKYQCSATVKQQQRCLQLFLLEPIKTDKLIIDKTFSGAPLPRSFYQLLVHSYINKL